MTWSDFAAKWRASRLGEMQAYQEHFTDLCRLVGHETPAEADSSGSFFVIQKAVPKESGRQGFADVWYRNRFGWEYKGKGGDLDRAYRQLLQYRDNLENPPLLIVSDFETIVVHTNFNGTVSETYTITLDDMVSGEPLGEKKLTAQQVLRACFYEPGLLKPGQTTEALTKSAAEHFGKIADALRAARSARYDPVAREHPREHADLQIAGFLSKLLFCMFVSDVGLLPKGVVGNLIAANRNTASQLAARFSALFEVMNTGGPYGVDEIPHFNGGLFRDTEALEIPSTEVEALLKADKLDWSDVEPSIFGTLFERVLDPDQRRQLGKHYTSREDIETIVRPVVMEPLEREWEGLQKEVSPLLRWDTQTGERQKAHREELIARLQGFLDHLGELRILDPACGSGNFLYVTMDLLKTLERKVVAFGVTHGVAVHPRVHPRQLFGIELNAYAHELASIVVWIGYLQWKRRNGLSLVDEDPILQPLDNIKQMDAILVRPDGGRPFEPEWPEADFIVGNPPFLGGKRLRNEKSGLGDEYVDALFEVWDGRVRREADLCCYWFEKARAMVAAGKARRVGLLATQAIRGGANRATLARIKESGGIFFAEADREWVLDGAAVRVSMVGFDDGSETHLVLDGQPVEGINANLTSQADLTRARRLKENLGISFMGDTKVGPFDIDAATAAGMLAAPSPHGKPNSDVVRPWVNGLDITRRPRGMWIIDFPPGTSEAEAALYEKPFEYIDSKVRPDRKKNARAVYAERWWIHAEARPEMRQALAGLSRYLATARVTKHRLFVWLDGAVLADSAVIAFARDDDYFFGVLHSRPHELWARATGTQLREAESGFRYTPTTCFETFPFPRPTPEQEAEIGSAAAELNRLRENWLNPPGMAEEELKKRTLTNLYNERPTWLANAHKNLDAAVFAAYGWPADLEDGEILARLLALNLEREAVGGGARTGG